MDYGLAYRSASPLALAWGLAGLREFTCAFREPAQVTAGCCPRWLGSPFWSVSSSDCKAPRS